MSLQKTSLVDLPVYIKLADSKASPKKVDLASALKNSGIDFRNQLMRNHSVLRERGGGGLGLCLEHIDLCKPMLSDDEILIKSQQLDSESDCCRFFVELCDMVVLGYEKVEHININLNNLRFSMASSTEGSCYGATMKQKRASTPFCDCFPYPELIGLACFREEISYFIKGDTSLLISGVDYSLYGDGDYNCRLYIYRDIKTDNLLLGLMLKNLHMPNMYYLDCRPMGE